MTIIARLIALLVVLPSTVFAVDAIDLQIDTLETAFISAKEIHLSYEPRTAAVPGFSLQIGHMRTALSDREFSVILHCPDASFDGPGLGCDKGVLQLTSQGQAVVSTGLDFQLDLNRKSGQLNLSAGSGWGKMTLRSAISDNQDWDLRVITEGLDLTLLSPWLASTIEKFSTHSIVGGKLDMQAHLQGSGGTTKTVSVDATLKRLGIEGQSTLEDVALHVQADAKQTGGHWTFFTTARMLAGAMYVQPGIEILGEEPGFYIEAPGDGVELRLAGNWSADNNSIELQDLLFMHPGILHLQGNARLHPGQDLLYSDFTIRAVVEELGTAYPIYIQPILLGTDFSDLELAGAIDLGLDYRAGQLNTLELFIDEVFLDDKKRRFSISALNSHLLLDNGLQPVQSRLAWSGMSFYRLDLGPGDIMFESVGRNVRVMDWQDVSILDGGLKIEEFNIHDFGGSDFRIRLGGELTPISMRGLTGALGWKVFPGKLSGRIAGLEYADNKLRLEGDISVSLFGGHVNIRGLEVRDLFSTYSVLTTDIEIDRLDLEQLTDVFTFGKIEGSLSGRMDRLRLENWQPGYFELELATPEDDDKPHRISQKALENLNELGGGLSGTLSQGFLRFLPAYSYGRLGFGCRLSNGICELSGVEDRGNSFFILTRGGLFPPWVEVRGAGRAIRWSHLIDGLKQIAEGEVKIE